MQRVRLTRYSEMADVLAALPLICREMRRVRGLSLRARGHLATQQGAEHAMRLHQCKEET